ncbi:MAG: hypothetical protein RMJ56_06125 [Gemmataceae bacterium]|nr:hypothetical protein [Gemmata sp.]MDW8197166.1 hypothetical protein [Gemmataceae bacterium]
MVRIPGVLMVLLGVAATPTLACTFCAENIRTLPTLRMQYAQAKAVYYGQLKNPRVDPRTDDVATDLYLTRALKDTPARGNQNVLAIREYIPATGPVAPEFIAFFTLIDGKLHYTSGVPASAATLNYLAGAVKLDTDAADSTTRLAYFFKHLASPDPVVAADAFVEFARTPDGEITRSAKHFDAAVLRKLIADEKTPSERLGVLAFLLGVCGTADDAAFLARQLKAQPLSERVRDAFGGLLAGYILLAPTDGWTFATAVLANAKQPFSVRLSTINTVRFFQATRGADYKAEILQCCAALLPEGDLADQAIEDLRRWGYWELTPEVLAQFPKPTHAAPIVRRSIVRYALSCPREEARAFIAQLRQTDPKLVATVEEQLQRLEARPR